MKVFLPFQTENNNAQSVVQTIIAHPHLICQCRILSAFSISYGIMVLLILLAARIFTAPAVPGNDTKTVKTAGKIEARYLAEGSYGVSYTEAAADGILKKYEVYYPSGLDRTYPAMLFVNRTYLIRKNSSQGIFQAGCEDT